MSYSYLYDLSLPGRTRIPTTDDRVPPITYYAYFKPLAVFNGILLHFEIMFFKILIRIVVIPLKVSAKKKRKKLCNWHHSEVYTPQEFKKMSDNNMVTRSVASFNKYKIKPLVIVVRKLLFVLHIRHKISTCLKCFSYLRNKINIENGNEPFVSFILRVPLYRIASTFYFQKSSEK